MLLEISLNENIYKGPGGGLRSMLVVSPANKQPRALTYLFIFSYVNTSHVDWKVILFLSL